MGYKFARQFSYTTRIYRGNLHMHTTRSDGVYGGERITDIFYRMKHDFVVVTDHNHWEDWRFLSRPDFLVMNGIEISSEKNQREHVLGVGLESDPGRAEDTQEAIDRIAETGGIPVLCHPLWSGIHTQRLLELHNYPLLEVMNHGLWGGAGDDDSHIWDELLIRGRDVRERNPPSCLDASAMIKKLSPMASRFTKESII